MLPPGSVMLMAAPVSSMPVPQTFAWAQSELGGKSRAELLMISRMWPGVSIGLRASNMAAVPETNGAAKLVPLAAT